MYALLLGLAQAGAATPVDPIDLSDPELQTNVQACAKQLGESPEDAALWRCLGFGDRYEACTAVNRGKEPDSFEACMGIDTPDTMPLSRLRETIAARHPLDMLTLARRTFDEAEDKAGGLFWFYASQLRWRTRLSCRDFEPGGEGALYGAMFATLGPMFNEWAGENIDVWLETLDKVHAWDVATKERYPEDVDCLVQAEDQRAGMLSLKQQIIENRTELEAKADERREARQSAGGGRP